MRRNVTEAPESRLANGAEGVTDVLAGERGALEAPGAVASAAGASYRVWAPKHSRVEVVYEERLSGAAFALEKSDCGYFGGFDGRARPGDSYRFRLDGEGPFPDPASRCQPGGPHGPSMLTD